MCKVVCYEIQETLALVGRGVTAEIRTEQLGLLKVSIHSSVDLSRSGRFIKEFKHQSRTAKCCNWVRNTLAHDIWSTAVAGLANCEALSNICAGHKSQAAYQRSSTVGKNITIKIGGNNDIVSLGLAEKLVDHGIDNLLLDSHR
ncbi:hypothetical protein HJFPF1_06826 [Paramyrothecium foliicola]|nr:hypothetical protein HJFPF1_06826 [Paramyrothecium foliicola]